MRKTCNICNNEKAAHLMNQGKFDIFSCKNCDSLFTNPLPSDDEIYKFYQGFKYSEGMSGQYIDDTKYKKLVDKKIKTLKSLFMFDDLNQDNFLDFLIYKPYKHFFCKFF